MSNKKRRGRGKQSTPKIPREEYVCGTTADVVSSLTFTFDPVRGTMSIPEVDPSTITRKLTHKRENKDDKIIYSAPAEDFSLSLGYIDELKKRFDYLIAVDTNTRKKPDVQNGYSVSASCMYCITEPLQAHTDEIPYQYLASYVILDTDMQAKHESLGWHLAIKHHIDTPFLRTQRIGVVVDSELGKHLEINSRTTPYHADFHLPANVSLLYASSDKTDTLANGMIKLCDAGATRLLDEVERRGLDELIQTGPPSEGTAKWFFNSGGRSAPSV
ncbi:hypothetical protein PFLmoz3_06186 [Pseudomonas fluorescens]|uniref:Uncharacterized protein n=2 Tax=Pseudomonas TaxID=286 RepID=A0A109KPK2_PSEFL|nr:hypothetical protein PFLmoz3_06186 [Pseudomonas fluorescens]